MSYDAQKLTISLPKAADFSASGQFCFGKVNSDGNVAIASRGDAAIGVIQDNGSVAGSATPVDVAGVTQVMFGGSVTPGDLLVSDANGHAITLSSGDNHVLGKALEAGSNGSVGAMLFQPASFS